MRCTFPFKIRLIYIAEYERKSSAPTPCCVVELCLVLLMRRILKLKRNWEVVVPTLSLPAVLKWWELQAEDRSKQSFTCHRVSCKSRGVQREGRKKRKKVNVSRSLRRLMVLPGDGVTWTLQVLCSATFCLLPTYLNLNIPVCSCSVFFFSRHQFTSESHAAYTRQQQQLTCVPKHKGCILYTATHTHVYLNRKKKKNHSYLCVM